jgi:hypothetical protein
MTDTTMNESSDMRTMLRAMIVGVNTGNRVLAENALRRVLEAKCVERCSSVLRPLYESESKTSGSR